MFPLSAVSQPLALALEPTRIGILHSCIFITTRRFCESVGSTFFFTGDSFHFNRSLASCRVDHPLRNWLSA